ncbi:MAG TPA: chromate efflux transporter [Devosia sp.]|nr:chromate efflux transporter [Devosia sp.]
MPLRRAADVFVAFLALGFTSFGGPTAHLGYFRDAFVQRRRWLDEQAYADLVALCQFLPGPASSQVGMAIGHQRAGWLGALAAWVGFTAPSVVLLYVVGLGAGLWQGPLATGVIHGLKLAALAVVAQAVWMMARRLTPDAPRLALGLVATIAILGLPGPATPVIVIAAAACLGALFGRVSSVTPGEPGPRPSWHSLWFLAAFGLLLVALPALEALTHDAALDIATRFYRTGALVFGGGHVVLPLLQNELVTPGLIDRDLFLAGYGAAQAVPGPLFSFAFYAGMLLNGPPNGIAGGLLALAAIYLPSFLLLFGALPWWARLRSVPRLRRALDGANAAVVGLLLAALITPVFSSTVAGPWDLPLAALALLALTLRMPPWLVVLVTGAIGPIFAGALSL